MPEYAPVLRIPGDRCAGHYRSDPPGYSDPAPDQKTYLIYAPVPLYPGYLFSQSSISQEIEWILFVV
jgi:hypothetical protein